MAKNFAYRIKFNSKPTKAYQLKTQKMSEQRVALAGYRLANLLNKLLG